MNTYILTLSCPDRSGIVAAVASALSQSGMNITDSHQFGDPDTKQFFMRVAFEPIETQSIAEFEKSFTALAESFAMQWKLYDMSQTPRVLILVSKFDHCLQDLIYRSEIGSLNMQIAGIMSNHETTQKRAAHADIPFFLMAGGKAEKPAHEKMIADFVAREKIDLVILARYMQILSEDLVQMLDGKVINIHHSFLPSFKGAVPYSRAYERGVKMIGATAHFVTAALDEGPIITQGVADIRHDMSVAQLVDVGRDIEKQVLAQAVNYYLQRRILLNGHKTVIFE